MYLVLDRPVKTHFVLLKLIGSVNLSMPREKVDNIILEDELLLWGTKIHPPTVDRTYSGEEAVEADNSKKQKDEWDAGLMEEGEHPFPFEFDLPAKSLPSSIDVDP